jgi:glutamate-1-semialdehyde aminotransferase
MKVLRPYPTTSNGPVDRAWYDRAGRVIPWATQTNAKRRPNELSEIMPAFLCRGAGCRVWDADGREYIDYDCSLGPIILGHGFPAVVNAVREQLEAGVLFSMASPLEVEVAELIRQMVPCAERVRFLKTGADANAACVRLARAVTGRDLIVITGYHGWLDPFQPDHDGVPETVRSLTVRCPFGNTDAVAQAFSRFPGRIAAVLTIPCNWWDPPSVDYLRGLRELTRQHDALLIFDEVLTGFRLAPGGAQEYFGVVPDLASFGKALANGFPLSAFVGCAEVMEEGLRKTIVTATHAGETLSLAAARATLQCMRSEPVHKHIWRVGEKLMTGLEAIFRERNLPARAVGLPPLFSIAFQTGDAVRDRSLSLTFARELLRRGIFYRGNRCFLSYSHGDDDIAHALAIVKEIVNEDHLCASPLL